MPLLLLALFCLVGTAMGAATFQCDGMSLNAEQLEDYEVAPGATYIVSVKDLADLNDVVESFKSAYKTDPEVLSSMGMFIAKLSQEQISWLLMNEKVGFVECDGVVSIAAKKAKDL